MDIGVVSEQCSARHFAVRGVVGPTAELGRGERRYKRAGAGVQGARASKDDKKERKKETEFARQL